MTNKPNRHNSALIFVTAAATAAFAAFAIYNASTGTTPTNVGIAALSSLTVIIEIFLAYRTRRSEEMQYEEMTTYYHSLNAATSDNTDAPSNPG